MKVQFPEVLGFLKDWSKDHRLIETALESCREALEDYVQEEEKLGMVPLNGYAVDEIQLRLYKMALVYHHELLDYPFIDTRIGLYVNSPWMSGDIYPIGRYRLITELNGEVDDDCLDIDEIGSDIQVLPIAFEMIPLESNEARDRLLDRFIEEAIVPNKLQFGGGGGGNVWSGYAEPAVPLTISMEQASAVESWVENQPEICRFKVGPIVQGGGAVLKQDPDADLPTWAR